MGKRRFPFIFTLILAAAATLSSGPHARAEDRPWFRFCVVTALNTPSGMVTSVHTDVVDPIGEVPGSIRSLTVAGPDDFHCTLAGSDYNPTLGYYQKIMETPPSIGSYVFTVESSFGATRSSSYYLASIKPIPPANPETFQASGDDLAPVLSWGSVNGIPNVDFPQGYEGNLFYMATIRDKDSKEIVWISPTPSPATYVWVPYDDLEYGRAYEWFVVAGDSYSTLMTDKASMSASVGLEICDVRPLFNYAYVYNRQKTTGFETMIGLRVWDPDGDVPDSIVSITVTDPEGGIIDLDVSASYLPGYNEFSLTLPGKPLDGIYTFTVEDIDGNSATTYDYVKSYDVPVVDSQTLQASGNPLAPELSWAAPEGMKMPLYYQVWIGDFEGNEVWRSGVVMENSVFVTPDVLQPSTYYQWKVRAYDAAYSVHYNRSDSGLVDLVINNERPYFRWYCTVYSRQDAEGTFFSTLDTEVWDPDGSLPGTITSIDVTGPAGFTPFSLTKSDYIPPNPPYYPLDTEYFHVIPVDPENPSSDFPTGLYTFTVTDANGQKAVNHDYYEKGLSIPLFDESSFQVSGDPMTPTVSWSAVADYPGHLFYRLSVNDVENKAVYRSPRTPYTSQSIPSGIIQEGQIYRYRIEATDNRNASSYNNRTNSHFFTLQPQLSLGAIGSAEWDTIVDVPVTLTTAGFSIAGLGEDITYDSNKLEFVDVLPGQAAEDAGKTIEFEEFPQYNCWSQCGWTTMLRILIIGADNNNAIADGVVAVIRFKVKIAYRQDHVAVIQGCPSATSPLDPWTGEPEEVYINGSDGEVNIQHLWGDCTGREGIPDGDVLIEDVVTSVKMFLGQMETEPCGDRNGDWVVTVDETQFTINNYLHLTPIAYRVVRAAEQGGMPRASLVLQPSVVKPGKKVKIPLVYTSHGVALSAVSMDIAYDGAVFSAPMVRKGPAAKSSGKELIFSYPKPGVLRVAALGDNANTLRDGILGVVTFTAGSTGNAGRSLLQCSSSASSPAGKSMPLKQPRHVVPVKFTK